MRIRTHDEAIAEARAARLWYVEREPDVARAFMAALDRAVELIVKMPNTWPVFEAGTRRYLLKNFPYYLIYREINNDIEVLAVMHERRRPGYWRHRLE